MKKSQIPLALGYRAKSSKTYFTLAEFERSGTATEQKIDNRVNDPAVLLNLDTLCRECLNPLREHYGMPIYVSSGYRCPQLNKAVRGVYNSQHMVGEAADILPWNYLGDSQMTKLILKEWAEWIQRNLVFDQLLLEHRGTNYWLHISYRRGGGNRMEVYL